MLALAAHVPRREISRVLSKDINERQESTNQETIDINKLWLAGGLARHRFGCKAMREIAGPNSAIIHHPVAIISMFSPFGYIYNADAIYCVPNIIVCDKNDIRSTSISNT